MPARRLELVVLALLAANTAYYIFAGRASEALDSLAWYVLLILFTLESARGQAWRTPKMLALMRGARGLATLAVAVTAVLYVREQAWLDAINLLLWIGIVALLEMEVRYPAFIAAHQRAFTLTAALLYAALGILVLIWLAQGEWMDAWDAALWLTAFGLLEIDLLGRNKNIV
jgi:hypothetical protein